MPANTASVHPTVTPRSQLPSAAALPGTTDHQPADELADDVNAVNSVQHAIRAGVAKHDLGYADRVVAQFGEYEQTHLTPDIDAFRTALSDTDQYLTEEFEAHFQDLESILWDRVQWYEKLNRGEWRDSIDDIADRAQTLKRSDSRLEVMTVAATSDAEQHPSAATTFRVDDLGRAPGAFGYELPHSFLGVYNAEKGSRYPFVPWYGTVVCTCPYKQQNAHMPGCKHELFAAAVSNADRYTAQLRALPSPYSQLVSGYGRRLLRDLFE